MGNAGQRRRISTGFEGESCRQGGRNSPRPEWNSQEGEESDRSVEHKELSMLHSEVLEVTGLLEARRSGRGRVAHTWLVVAM